MKAFCAMIFAVLCVSAVGAENKPVPRSDAFYGMHFDLHPGAGDTELGAGIAEENIEKLLLRAKPDYVQYDCKGHPGYTGYPTKIGYASPGIVKDSLAIWRKVTQKHGVGLYIHYSGVWDTVAIQHHPEWAVIDAAGKPNPDITSNFGPYTEKLMIPQLREVAEAYQLDGIWADGECWAAKLDYSPAALEAWKKETGFAEAPKKAGDPHWQEWKMFHRRAFERHMSQWVDAMHAFNPKLQVTSNWMYSTMAPMPIRSKVDFLSGDYSPGLSVDRARTEARYLASNNMPWDLMAWGFNKATNVNWSLKPPVQLQQEAAVVLMQGGGFQVYNVPIRTGHLIDPIIEQLGQVGNFCRVRQQVSHESMTVPQVALLLSVESQMERSEKVFDPRGTYSELEGTLHALLELHYSVDILAEHQLQPRLKEFPLVVIPDSHKLTEDFRKAVLAYVRDGGSLLLLGEQCARLFEPDLGVKLDGKPQQMSVELATPAGPVNVNGLWQAVTPTTAKPIGYRYPTRDTRKNGQPAATIVACGKGQIGAVYGPVVLAFFHSHHTSLRGFVGDVVQPLLPSPAVRVQAPACVDVSLRRTVDGRLSVHLLNRSAAPVTDAYGFVDFIPAVGPIRVRLRMAQAPKNVTWVPDGGKLDWSYADGMLSVSVPSLHIHGVLVAE